MTVSPDRPQEKRARRKRSRLGCALRVLLAVLVVLVVAGLAVRGWFLGQLRASLPQLAGELTVDGVDEPVVVERDALGIPTIRGASRRDVAFATGFVHAQDRFFQMDLLRRRAAGELSEILGASTLGEDRRNRIHRLRAQAERALAASRDEVREVVAAYSDGVNAGLDALGAKPFEYVVLFAEPRPWSPEDTFLVLLSMFLELDDEDGANESDVELMYELLPRPLVEFLLPVGTEWDAPMVGGAFATPAPPGPEVFDLRAAAPAGRVARPAQSPEPGTAASNAWAVAGSHTANGAALLVDDVHLPITVPNIWYRAVLSWPVANDPGAFHRVVGVTLPGAPAMVVGSNGHVAWGITNSLADTSDVVWLDKDPGRDDAYLTPDGPRPFEHHTEVLRVRGADDEVLETDWTVWGPVVGEDHQGRRYVARWIAHEAGAVDLNVLALETARDVDVALDVAHESGLPALSTVFADAGGRIAWTEMGRLPRRLGFDGRLPGSWADGTRRWDGLLPPAQVPRVDGGETGRVWIANNRAVDGEMLAVLGAGDYRLGARAHQIRDDLLALEKATPADMWNVLLDDRAIFLDRWRGLLLGVLTPEAVAADPRRGELRKVVENWQGRAAVDSAGYLSLRSFRILLFRDVFGALTAACRAADPDFDYPSTTNQHEGPLWRLVTERPGNLLDPRFKTWDEQILDAADQVLDLYLPEGGSLDERTWGKRNTATIHHTFSRVLPFVGRWLDMPSRQMPGGDYMPRVQDRDYGSTLRMVVSPGREEEGFLHMPCGQSAHPLSPHYGDAQEAWADGEPTPLLPGPAVHTLKLVAAPAEKPAGR